MASLEEWQGRPSAEAGNASGIGSLVTGRLGQQGGLGLQRRSVSEADGNAYVMFLLAINHTLGTWQTEVDFRRCCAGAAFSRLGIRFGRSGRRSLGRLCSLA